ncbi:MAG TPA: glycerol-3-phosphate 1-O-acyltransferase PlsY [Planctomycetaceae bacterium]|nr:glycerol-3-phosphate 1-O-acyltransferase PlsY [Planctomycetaceae bacterium]
MTLTASVLIAAALAYLIGSLPFGYLTARWVAGIDIRREGSGNIGATNIARVLGAKWGAGVLVLDCLKGLLPVLFLPPLLLPADGSGIGHVRVAAAVAAVVGHMFPLWLGFRGGKGVATSLGVALVVSPWGTLAAVGAFVACVAATRIVSLGSITAAVVFAGFQMWRLSPQPFGAESWSVAALSLLVPVLILARHRSNVVRIVQGREPRFGSAPRAAGDSNSALEGTSGESDAGAVER